MIPATRLVSKQFHTISTPFFGQNCLSSLAFMLSEYSLSRLVELTESKLVKYIKKLVFSMHILKIESEEERKIDRRWEEYEREAEEEELREELGLPPLMEADESEDERRDAIEPELRLEELLGERTPSPEERNRREELRNNIQDEPSANSTTNTTAHQDRKPENQLTNQEVEEANVAAEALMTFYDKSKAMTNFLNSERHVKLMSQAFKNLKTANVQVSLGFYDDGKIHLSLATYGLCARLLGDNAFREINLMPRYVELDRLMKFLREMTQSLRVLCLRAVDMRFDGIYVGRIDGEWETVEEIQNALQEDIDREESGHVLYDLDYESSQEDEEDEDESIQFVEVNEFDEFGDDDDSSSKDEDEDYDGDINDESWQ
ncbi:hypothetical protein D6D01_03394 [Aureobasidium pullulans]|uniref:Uncharacterized protein n=1 Tax=Aureobasidium pullulans TaxID=5580 RepID=A0A4V4JWL2_AURPU|nr:hypothetical protein D6D01_03394 [Aureobasidium pullulans]